MKPRPREGLTIRAALLLAFGLTLGLWLFSGFSLTRRMTEMRRQAEAVNARYTRAQELLSTVRSQVLLGSVYVRDALLDPNPGATTDYRRQFDEAVTTAREALSKYDPVLDSAAERPRVDQLQREVEAFRSAMLEALSSDSTRWPTEARLLIRSRVMPRRENVVQVSEEVQSLNRSAFIQQQAAASAVYAAMQRRVWIEFGFALAASFGIGLFSIRHVAGLEERLRQQTEREAQHAHDLQRLSTQLVTAQEDERRTIARELHDEVGQVLTAIKVELAIAQRCVEACGASPDVLSSARSITDQALRTVRDLSHLLHPAVLDDLGLPAAIDGQMREVSSRHGIRAQLLHEQMDRRLTRDIEAAVYRIVQEALTNIVRHASATGCRVYLQQLPNSVVITVEDDGVGFDVAQVVPAGLGLLGIRERAAQLGGTVRLESAPAKGTRLTVELPAQYRATMIDADAVGAEAPSEAARA